MKSPGKFKISVKISVTVRVAVPSRARDGIRRRKCLNRIGALNYLSDEFSIELSAASQFWNNGTLLFKATL